MSLSLVVEEVTPLRIGRSRNESTARREIITGHYVGILLLRYRHDGLRHDRRFT